MSASHDARGISPGSPRGIQSIDGKYLPPPSPPIDGEVHLNAFSAGQPSEPVLNVSANYLIGQSDLPAGLQP